MAKTSNTKYTKGKHQRGGDYKLAYRPVNYYGQYAHCNNLPEEEKPLLYFMNNTLGRCYYLVEKCDLVWAAIYKNKAGRNTPPVDVWTANNQWTIGNRKQG